LAAKLVISPIAGDFEHWRTNVVVIGSGVAGLSCALALAPTPVTLLTKTRQPFGGSSVWAQGGIAAAVGDEDSASDHALDTIAAGAGVTDPKLAQILAEDGSRIVHRLIDDGVPFDRSPQGAIALGREAAHGRPRIVHAGGDATGRTLIQSLLDRVANTPTIQVLSDAFALDLVAPHGRASGVIAFHKERSWINIHANAVVLACGGDGSLWRETTNPSESTGDGLAIAARAGAALADLEFVQFHPTSLVPRRCRGGVQLALLTEALRGAGAVLLDAEGSRFMLDEHPLAELAPRDVVAREIARRTVSGETVFLDLRPALSAAGLHAFPQALESCRREGYEPTTEPVPVAPAAHYHMGGVLTDENGLTDIANVWACGEVACTGVHGANRLASNSLLEGLVFAERVADSIRRHAESDHPASFSASTVQPLPHPGFDPVRMREVLRDTMSRNVGLTRSSQGLTEAAATLDRLQSILADSADIGKTDRDQAVSFEHLVACGEVRNMILAARLITESALRRRESRGAHYRTDFPRPSETWLRRQVIRYSDLDHPAEHCDAGSTRATIG